jgi:hypothetical protein
MSDFCLAVGNPPNFMSQGRLASLIVRMVPWVLIPFAMLTLTLRLKRHDFENIEVNVQNLDE